MEAGMIVGVFNTMLAKFRCDYAGEVKSSGISKHKE